MMSDMTDCRVVDETSEQFEYAHSITTVNIDLMHIVKLLTFTVCIHCQYFQLVPFRMQKKHVNQGMEVGYTTTQVPF